MIDTWGGEMPKSQDVNNFFIQEVIKTGAVHLLCLSDSSVRLRDPLAVQAFLHYCDRNGIECVIRQVLASHRRFFDLQTLKHHLGKNFIHNMKEKGVGADQFWETAFAQASASYSKEAREIAHGLKNQIPPSGPVVILGRWEHFSFDLREAISRELPGPSPDDRRRLFDGRFKIGSADAGCADADRIIIDRITSSSLRAGKSPDLIKPGPSVDYCVVRKLNTNYNNRCHLLVMGVSALGTLAGTILITEPQIQLQDELRRFYEDHSYVEILLRVEIEDDFRLPWRAQLPPQSIALVSGLLALPSGEVETLTTWLTDRPATEPVGEEMTISGMTYRHTGTRKGGDGGPIVEIAVEEEKGREEHDSFVDLGFEIVGGNCVRESLRTLHQIATLERPGKGRDNAALLCGQTGAGKTLFARAMLRYRMLALLGTVARDGRLPDKACTLVEMTCNTVPDALVPTELFGHKRGAYTGAETERSGLVAAAGCGVFFLDEIQSLSLSNQVILLRMIDNRTIRMIGHSQERPVHCMVLGAINERPEDLMTQGRLRRDFHFRFRKVVSLPPVQSRPADLVAIMAAHAGKPIQIGIETLNMILSHHHEGGIRGLQQVVNNSLYRDPGGNCCQIMPEDLDESMKSGFRKNFPDGEKIVDGQASTTYEFTYLGNGDRELFISTFDEAARILMETPNHRNGDNNATAKNQAEAWLACCSATLHQCGSPETREKMLGLLRTMFRRRFPTEIRGDKEVGYVLNKYCNAAENQSPDGRLKSSKNQAGAGAPGLSNLSVMSEEDLRFIIEWPIKSGAEPDDDPTNGS